MKKTLLYLFLLALSVIPLSAQTEGAKRDAAWNVLDASIYDFSPNRALLAMLPLAEAGDADAQCYVGLMYKHFSADIADCEWKEAEEKTQLWLKKAAAQGNDLAQYALVEGLYTAAATTDKYKLADRDFFDAPYTLGCENLELLEDRANPRYMAYYRKAAGQGFAKAQHKLAQAYAAGKGVRKNAAESLKWLKAAADQGYSEALYDLAMHYADAGNADHDYTQTVHCLKEAVRRGHRRAYAELARCYFHGRGVKKDPVLALMYKLVPLEAGQELVVEEEGCDIEESEYAKDVIFDIPAMRTALNTRAAAGDADAQYVLAVCSSHNYLYAVDFAEEDQAAARLWMEKAAAQGQPYALGRMGDCLLEDMKLEEGFAFYEKAAETFPYYASFVAPQYDAPVSEGVYCQPDDRKAFSHYLAAANMGDDKACAALAGFYESGRAVEQDYAEALKWIYRGEGLGTDHSGKTVSPKELLYWKKMNAAKFRRLLMGK